MAANEELVHGWVSTDCGRGTSDILWTCLATILLCVWTVIHLPVPCCSRFEQGKLVPGEPSRSWRNWTIRSAIVPAVISVIAPEFLTFTAIVEFLEARSTKEEMTKMDWTLTHTYFLHMGGFCLETPSGLRLQLGRNDLLSAISATVSPDWLLELENVKEFHINHHAKSDPLTKSIACGQAFWLVAQVISRVCQHRAVTLLEVSTLAYATCALTSYVFWWKKPQNASLPITIPCSDETILRRGTDNLLYYSETSLFEFYWAGQNWLEHFIKVSDPFGQTVSGLIALCAAIFGAIHVASWNILLPSSVEQWLWRASALYCCTSGGLVVLVDIFLVMVVDHSGLPGGIKKSLSALGILGLPLLYVIVRIYMIVEVFLSIRALPQSAYQSVQWLSFVPHI